MSALPHRLRISGRTSELARVRRHVAAWAVEAGLGDAATRRIQLAVDETVANAIEHGMAHPDTDRITVEAALDDRALTVAVRHRGDRFDPTQTPAVSTGDALRQRAKHGYGLHLIRRLVDDVSYRHTGARRGPGTNEVRLVQRRG